MTETQDAPAPSTDSGSFLGNLFNLYFEPEAAFGRIFAKPRLILVMLLQVALGVMFTSIWLEKMNPREFMRGQIEHNPRVQQLPAEQVEQIIEGGARSMKTRVRVVTFAAPLILDLVLGGLLMFVFRFFMAADVSFLKALATTAWTFAAVGVIHTPILLAVFALKDDWNLDPNAIVQANPTIFFEVADLPGALWTLLASFDLFTLWTCFLLAKGLAKAAGRGFSTGAWGVGVLWGIWIAAKVGFRLIFG